MEYNPKSKNICELCGKKFKSTSYRYCPQDMEAYRKLTKKAQKALTDKF